MLTGAPVPGAAKAGTAALKQPGVQLDAHRMAHPSLTKDEFQRLTTWATRTTNCFLEGRSCLDPTYQRGTRPPIPVGQPRCPLPRAEQSRARVAFTVGKRGEPLLIPAGSRGQQLSAVCGREQFQCVCRPPGPCLGDAGAPICHQSRTGPGGGSGFRVPSRHAALSHRGVACRPGPE